MIGSAFHHVPQLVAGIRIEKIQRVVLKRRMNARLSRQKAGAFQQRRVPHFPGAVQGGDLPFERHLQLLPNIRSDLVLGDPQGESGHRADHQHHPDEQAQAEAGDARRGVHGKFSLVVLPAARVTDFSSVVRLSIHALSL